MMKQAHADKGHDHALFIALFDDQIIANRATGLCNVLNTGSKGTLHVTAEGEKCIAAQRNIAVKSQPGPLVAFGKTLRLLGEAVLPNAVCTDILFVAVDVSIDNIVAISTPQIRTELQPRSLGMLAQEPGVSLGTCKSGAVDEALLTAPIPIATFSSLTSCQEFRASIKLM